MLSIADYLLDLKGTDIAYDFRGRYTTEQQAKTRLSAAGGPVALMERSGLPDTTAPERGDIMLVEIGGEMIGALCTGGAMAARLERGVIELDIRFVHVMRCWSCQ